MRYLVLLLLVGCGTTSTMKCDKYVGFEKEECVEQVELKQRERLDRLERLSDRSLGRRKY